MTQKQSSTTQSQQGKKPKLIVLTGAGISAESGISTFRDANGLWENHDVMEVASWGGWLKNPELVLEFYNQRRAQLHEVEPNLGHLALAQAEAFFDVVIVTQNVDDLHERASSSKILHLHGELRKIRSTVDHTLIQKWEDDVKIGQLCPKGSQLRPHIVWFGEQVPMIEFAQAELEKADAIMVVGTSMQVYPAAGLVSYAPPSVPIWYVDPNPGVIEDVDYQVIPLPATKGVPQALEEIKTYFAKDRSSLN